MDDVILNKSASMERCLLRISEEAQKDWINNFTYQDAILLNPKYARDVFEYLYEVNMIPQEMKEKLQKMVGFRNLLVHEYGSLNLKAVKKIILNDLSVFSEFSSLMLKEEC